MLARLVFKMGVLAEGSPQTVALSQFKALWVAGLYFS